jgi:hypothetical protein
MPLPGWYDDPERPLTWRYWDGARWSDHRAPHWVPPVRDPTSFSTWFERSVDAVKLAVRRVGLLLVSVWLLLAVLGWGLMVAVFESDRGRELRRLLDVDQTFFGAGSTVTFELTNAEADRAWELTQQLFWSALPWTIALVVASIVASAWSVALVAQAVKQHVVSEQVVGDVPADPSNQLGSIAAAAAAAAAAALRRVPAVAASGLVVGLIFAGVWVLAALPVVAVAVVDGGGATIVLTVMFAALAALVATAWLWGRLTLASVIAASGGHVLGVRRSWHITHDRFWFVVGRLLVAGLIAGVAGGVANLVINFGQFLGVGVFFAIVFLIQAIAFVVSTIITVCAHLVTIDQVGRGRAGER